MKKLVVVGFGMAIVSFTFFDVRPASAQCPASNTRCLPWYEFGIPETSQGRGFSRSYGEARSHQDPRRQSTSGYTDCLTIDLNDPRRRSAGCDEREYRRTDR